MTDLHEIARQVAINISGLPSMEARIDGIEAALLAREAEVWKEAARILQDHYGWSVDVTEELRALASRGNRQRTEAENVGEQSGAAVAPSLDPATVRHLVERAMRADELEAEVERLRKEVGRLTKQLIRAQDEAQYFPD